MLRRAMHDERKGLCIDVGAYDTCDDSVIRWFYGAGWHGINVELNPVLLARLKKRRRRDVNLGVAVNDRKGKAAFHVLGGAGHSTLYRPDRAHLLFQVEIERRVQLVRLDGLIVRYVGLKAVDFSQDRGRRC